MAAWTCSEKPVRRSMRSETPLGASDIFTMAPEICSRANQVRLMAFQVSDGRCLTLLAIHKTGPIT